jgi:phage FluMu protein Com
LRPRRGAAAGGGATAATLAALQPRTCVGFCNKLVSQSEAEGWSEVQCEQCEAWFHADCIYMTQAEAEVRLPSAARVW